MAAFTFCLTCATAAVSPDDVPRGVWVDAAHALSVQLRSAVTADLWTHDDRNSMAWGAHESSCECSARIRRSTAGSGQRVTNLRHGSMTPWPVEPSRRNRVATPGRGAQQLHRDVTRWPVRPQPRHRRPSRRSARFDRPPLPFSGSSEHTSFHERCSFLRLRADTSPTAFRQRLADRTTRSVPCDQSRDVGPRGGYR